MTDDEARKLATRIVDTWPNGAKAYVWRDVLIALDARHAAVAYRTLSLDEHAGKSPTPAQFHAHYRKARQPVYDGPTGPSFEGPVMPLSDPRAAGAFEHGYAQGQAELARIRQHLPPNEWGPHA